jgi:hypothetical protein
VNRVAVVTGGASGIGAATVDLLRAHDADVAVFDLAGDDPVDVSDPASVERGVENVRETRGPIEILRGMKRFVLAVDAPYGMPLNTWIPLAVYPRTLPALVSTTGSLILRRPPR